MVQPTTEHLEKHYADLSSKGFFKGLISYMASGPVVAMVWEGKDAVKTGRVILGATNPKDSAPGTSMSFYTISLKNGILIERFCTVRGDYAIDVGRNVCHGSDAVES